MARKVPTVVVCGWMHAPSRGVAKYADLFQRLGYRTETVEAHVGHLFMPPAWIHAKSTALAALASSSSEEELVIIPHMISGGGCISWYCMERHLRHRGVRFRVPAMIFDSSPNSAKGFSVFRESSKQTLNDLTSSIHSPARRYVAKSILTVGWAAVLLRWAGPLGPDPLQRNFDKLIVQDAAIPKLFLYSSNDSIITSTEVEEAVAAADSLGTAVDRVNFESSPHVGHFLDFPDLYEKSVVEFLKKWLL